MKNEILYDYNLNCPASLRGPVQIISLDIGSDGNFSGWCEIGGRYGKYYACVYQVNIEVDFMEYRDLEHFVDVAGKFDPYSWFKAEPLVLPELTRAALDEIKGHYPQYDGY